MSIYKCQFFKVSTSSCLRTVANTIMSLERGLLNLCLQHSGEQKERDMRLRACRSVQEQADASETTIVLEATRDR